MTDFLFWIGLYNLSAPLVFLPMFFSERFTDFVLRRATEIIAEPYTHGPYGRMWIIWIVGANTALGATMMLATTWPLFAQQQVRLIALGVYALTWLAMLIGSRGPRWGRGVYVTHILWIAQMAWGAWEFSKN